MIPPASRLAGRAWSLPRGRPGGIHKGETIMSATQSPPLDSSLASIDRLVTLDTRDVLRRMPFGCCWVLTTRRPVELGMTGGGGPGTLSTQDLVEAGAAELRSIYGDALGNTLQSRIIPIREDGHALYYALFPGSEGSDGVAAVDRAWNSLSVQLEYRARRLGLMGEDEYLSDSGARPPMANEDARSRIVEFLRGACANMSTIEDPWDITIGQVLDGLTEACRVAGVLIVDGAEGASRTTTPIDHGPETLKRLPAEARAVAMLLDNPRSSDTQIAKDIGCHRSTLYRSPKYVTARNAIKAGRSELPKGQKDAESGDVEAWD